MPIPYAATVAPHRLSRRSFLKIGGLGVAGLTLPQLLRAENAAGIQSSQKSVIMIYLVGGPPHQDMFDLKPNAPAGDRRALAADRHQCSRHRRSAKLFPQTGADDGQARRHSLARRQSGRARRHPGLQRPSSAQAADPSAAVGRNSARSVAQAARPGRPAPCRRSSASATPCTHGPYNEPGPGFLGRRCIAVPPAWVRRATTWSCKGVTLDRLADRRSLLRASTRFAATSILAA